MRLLSITELEDRCRGSCNCYDSFNAHEIAEYASIKVMNVSNMQKTSKLAVIGLLLAVCIAPVGFITSIIAWHKINKHSLRGKGIAIAGTVIGGLLSLPFLLFTWLFIVLGGWHGNQAEKDVKPMITEVQELGATKLCDNGDSGYSIDNTTPWYQVYYSVPDSSELTEKINSLAANEGYQLHTNSDLVAQLKGLPDQNGVYSQAYGGEQFSPQSDYLIAHASGKTLKVNVYRQAEVALYCSAKDYGKKESASTNAILDISVTLPDRQQ